MTIQKLIQENHIFYLSTNKREIVSIDGIPLVASEHKKLLGVTTDSELKLENHIKELCLKVDKKPNAPCCISSSMSLVKSKTLMKVFIESQFNYCPLIWMLHCRALNNKINHIHERALRVVHSTIIRLSINHLIKIAPLRFLKKMSQV